MSDFEELYAKMSKAPMRRGKGNYMGTGLFVVEVISTIKKMGWNKAFTVRDKELFIAEFKIIESNNPAHGVGSTASWTCKDPTTANSGDVKAFMIALFGTDPRVVKDDDVQAQAQASLLAFAAMGYAEALAKLEVSDGFLAGRRVALETKVVPTKAGGEFTVHSWSPAV